MFKTKFKEIIKDEDDDLIDFGDDLKRQVHFIKNLKVFNTNLESSTCIKDKMQKVMFGTPQAKIFKKEKFEKEKKLLALERSKSLSKSLLEDDDYNFYQKELGFAS